MTQYKNTLFKVTYTSFDQILRKLKKTNEVFDTFATEPLKFLVQS